MVTDDWTDLLYLITLSGEMDRHLAAYPFKWVDGQPVCSVVELV